MKWPKLRQITDDQKIVLKALTESAAKPSMKILEVGNWLAHYQILDNAQNPLILSVEVAPGAKIAELLFSPLGIVKGLVEYQVKAFKNPKITFEETL